MSLELDDFVRACMEVQAKSKIDIDAGTEAALGQARNSLLMALGSIERRLDALEKQSGKRQAHAGAPAKPVSKVRI
jgi:hypothetical protein